MNSPRSRARSSDQVNSKENIPSTPELIRHGSSEESVVVDIAETGERHLVQVQSRDTPTAYEFFIHKLELISGIPKASLIILAGPPFKSCMRGFPDKGAQTYLFDKRALNNAKTSKVVFQRMLAPALVLPTTPTDPPDAELQQLLERLQSTNLPPLHSTLPMYERHLMLHLNKSQAMITFARKTLTQCENWCCARQRQVGALNAAVGNLMDHLQRTSEEYRSMASALTTQQSEGKILLDGFEEAMSRLMATPLHPAIASALGGDKLSSCIPHERYTPYVAQCRNSQQRLARSADDMKVLHAHLESSAKELEATRVDEAIDMDCVREMVKCEEVVLEAAETLYQGVRADVIKNVATLLEPDHPDPSGFLRAVLEDLEQRRMAAEGDLTKMSASHEKLTEFSLHMAELMDRGAGEVRSKVAEVSAIQRSIVNLQQHVKLRTEALKQQREDFVHLEMIHRLPEEVSLFEKELKRRQRWQTTFAREVQAAQQHLAGLYKAEVEKREAYLHGHGQYLPPCFSTTVCPAIFQKPPRFRVDLATEAPKVQLFDEEEAEKDRDEDENDGVYMSDALRRCAELEDQVAKLKQTVLDTSVEVYGSAVAGEVQSHQQVDGTNEEEEGAAEDVAVDAEDDLNIVKGDIIESGRDVEVGKDVEFLLSMLEETLPVHITDQMFRVRDILSRSLEVVTETRNSSMISFKSFQPGNVVLFLPVYPKKEGEGNLLYLAFNEQCPRHYLNQESAEIFKSRNNDKFPHFIVGRIIVVDRMVAGVKGDVHANPFDVSEGTEFHVITIEAIS